MIICLVGEGTTVFHLAETLLDEENQVYVLYEGEEQPDFPKHSNLRLIPWSYGKNFSLGNNTWSMVDYCITLTDNDEKNILWASILRERGVQCSLALINSYDTYRTLSQGTKGVFVDGYFNKTQIMAENIEKYFKEDGGIPGETFGDSQLEVFRYTINYETGLTEEPIANIKDLEGLLIVSIYRGNEFFVPSGSTILKNGDKLYIMGKREEIAQFKKIHTERILIEERQGLWILGNGMESIDLAVALGERGYEIKLTLSEKEQVKAVRDHNPNIFVEFGELTKLRTYQQEDGRYSGVICASDNDDENVLMALLADYSGEKQVVTILENADYAKVTEGLPITLQLRPNLGVTSFLMRRLRGKNRISIYLMLGGTTEVVEMTVEESSPAINQSLKNLKLPEGVIIGGIIREDGEVIIPNGKTEIQVKDQLVIFCSSKEREVLAQLINYKKNRGFFSELINLY